MPNDIPVIVLLYNITLDGYDYIAKALTSGILSYAWGMQGPSTT